MPLRLDERLTAVANQIDYGVVADIGCDHGKLGYYLLSTDRASKVIATDISEGSLKKARELAYENGVTELMDTRLGDGLNPLSDREANTVVIAGLGGDVISDILERARLDGKRFEHFVLCINTHPEKVRREILKQKHTIISDFIVECSGKRYALIKTREGEDTLGELEILFGKFYRTDENFKSLAQRELASKRELYEKFATPELENKIALLSEALENTDR